MGTRSMSRTGPAASLQWWSQGALVAVTLVWGTTFSITKQSLASVPPILFLALRFTLASAALAPIVLWQARRCRFSVRFWPVAALLGAVQFVGFAAQTVGLAHTTASKAAFITGLSVVIVPVLERLFYQQRFNGWIWAGVALATAGLAVLSVNPAEWLWFSWGDLLVLLCAVAFALYIVVVGRHASHVDALLLTAGQIVLTALLSWGAGLALEGPLPPLSPAVWGALAFLALIATVGTTWVQMWAQKVTDPTHTALIFSLEPVFAAVFAFLLLGETPGWRTWLGGAAILGGMILAERSPRPAAPAGGNRPAPGRDDVAPSTGAE
ncbi:MAG: DMT family transporter [Firmicutes bacterium]|nr:DMT family transporter [Bacillota bacterium]